MFRIFLKMRAMLQYIDKNHSNVFSGLDISQYPFLCIAKKIVTDNTMIHPLCSYLASYLQKKHPVDATF